MVATSHCIKILNFTTGADIQLSEEELSPLAAAGPVGRTAGGYLSTDVLPTPQMRMCWCWGRARACCPSWWLPLVQNL